MKAEAPSPLDLYTDLIAPVAGEFPANFEKLLSDLGILSNSHRELSGVRTFIDWLEYPDRYSFNYDFLGNREAMQEFFNNSELRHHAFVIMQFGNVAPMAKIPVDLFVQYWSELLCIADHETVILSEDGTLFLEFEKKYNRLISNFQIRR